MPISHLLDTALPHAQPATTVESSEPEVVRLAALLRTHAPCDGRFDLRIPGVHVLRLSRTDETVVHAIYHPTLCIVAQGAKRLLLRQEVYAYDISRMLVVTIDLPVAAQVTHGSYAAPFLCFRLDLDPIRIAELVLKVYPYGVPQAQEKRAIYVSPSSASIVNAAARLMELATQPRDAELIAPLVIDEILIRLLRSPIGSRVAHVGLAESSGHKIARAVDWIRANFSGPMNVEALAKQVHMSVSSFHQHFKAVTSMSPLQYQKILRLQEARRLMVSTMMDASTASRQVGYVSASQFSREYSRYFGCAPTRDITKLREQDMQQLLSER